MENPSNDQEPAEQAVQPNRPHAKLIRQALSDAGIEPFVESIHSSHRATRLYFSKRHRLDMDPLAAAEAVAEALAPLWNDSKDRIEVTGGFIVRIDQAEWEHTAPDTPEGHRYLQEQAADRNEELLRAKADGQSLRSRIHTAVWFHESDEYPGRPWVDHFHRRFNPWEVTSVERPKQTGEGAR